MPRGEEGVGSTKGGPLGHGAKAISLSRGIRGMARLEDHASRTLWFFPTTEEKSGERRGRRANKAKESKRKKERAISRVGEKKRYTKGGHGKRSNGVQSRGRLRLKVLVMAFGEQFCIETVVLPPPSTPSLVTGDRGEGRRPPNLQREHSQLQQTRYTH